jgi:hypothetical protein
MAIPTDDNLSFSQPRSTAKIFGISCAREFASFPAATSPIIGAGPVLAFFTDVNG